MTLAEDDTLAPGPTGDVVAGMVPGPLRGGDYIQTANADKLYNAMDLMQVAVKGGAVVSVAHDDRLPRPDWLQRQFSPTDLSIAIGGRPMRIFQHHAKADESLTLGTNTEDAALKACNMYVVFVNAASGLASEQASVPAP